MGTGREEGEEAGRRSEEEGAPSFFTQTTSSLRKNKSPTRFTRCWAVVRWMTFRNVRLIAFRNQWFVLMDDVLHSVRLW